MRKLRCFFSTCCGLLLLNSCFSCSRTETASVNLSNRPTITSISPTSGEVKIFRNTPISVNVSFPKVGIGVEASTLNTTNVKLYRTRDNTFIPGIINTNGGGDVIVYQPTGLLDSSTNYTFEITQSVKDQSGASFLPFSETFTTGKTASISTDTRVKFLKTQVYNGAPLTSLLISPDRKMLYASSLDGNLRRWNIDNSGNLTNLQTFEGLAGRAIIGIAFDPKNPNVLWVSHNNPVVPHPAEDFTGKISKLYLSEPDFNASIQDYIVGLPRSAKDHMANSLVFGPDGIYVSIGANSGQGAPDKPWYYRPERLLTATLLQIDHTRTTGLPFNVQTEPYEGKTGNYNPYAPNAPVKIYATGLRSCFDLVWATNGSLYVPCNGGSEGGITPASPPKVTPVVPAVINGPTQDDFLFKVVQGGYYGHPNPLRKQYVMDGGNPTSGIDPAEVVAREEMIKGKVGLRGGYPVGIKPDVNYKGFTWNFGHDRSPNGVIEYKTDTFGSTLKNKLLFVEYSGGDDIVALALDPNGNIPSGGATQVVSGLKNPLDLVEDTRNGNIYVAELILKPKVDNKFFETFPWVFGQRPPSPSGQITLLRVNE